MKKKSKTISLYGHGSFFSHPSASASAVPDRRVPALRSRRLFPGGLDLPPEPAAEPSPEATAGAEEEPEGAVLGAEEPIPVETDEYVFGAAPIDRVRVLVTGAAEESDRIIVLAEGYLPDGCTELYDVEVEREGTTFHVGMITRRPKDRVCIEVAIPFRERVPLNVLDLPEGKYLVRVNEGAMGTFTIGVDHELLGVEEE